MKGRVLDGAVLVLDRSDTVGTALENLAAGRVVALDGAVDAAAGTVALREAVPFGHKVALVAHDRGEQVRKYGEVIGRTTAAVRAGEHVHTHNCESTRGRGDLAAREGAE